MRHGRLRNAAGFAVILAATLALSACGSSNTERRTAAGDVVVVDPVVPEPPANLGSAYMVIRNTGAAPERLLRVETDLAGAVELHQTRAVDGRLGMVRVESVEIAPGGEFSMESGGFHVMLIDLKRSLRQGERVPLTLTFERAGTVRVEALVVATAGAPEPHRDHGKG